MTKTILIALGGAAVACALILSCGGDDQGGTDARAADAQTACDCPTSEPPLAGRIVRVTETIALAAQDTNGASALCDTGATLLGGGCDLEMPDKNITIVQNAPAKPSGGVQVQAWTCQWNNPTTDANTGIATAICLMPAPAN